MPKRYILAIVLIIVLGFAVYGNSLQGKFIWDDTNLVRDNLYIRNWSNLAKVFTESMGAGAGIPEIYSFYRPLQMLTYFLDYSFWKSNVKGYHLSNILFHILVALVIFWLINLAFGDWLLSLFTSLFFLVHPIHTEAVTYISGRADSLVAVLMLLTLIFYIKLQHKENKTLYLFMLASYILALLTRESALILPLLLIIYNYSFKQRLKLKQFLPIPGLAIFYILLRLTALDFLPSRAEHATSTLGQRIPGIFVALTNYLRLLVLPFNLHMEYGKKLFSPTHPQVLLGVLTFIFLLICILKQKKIRGLIFFALLWFFITLLPVSNLYPLNAYMAEHWLYLPSIGLFLIIGAGLSFIYRTKQLKTAAVILTIFLLAVYASFTIRQNTYWQVPIAFYQRTLKYAPDSSRVYYNLANAHRDIGKNKEAIPYYQRAIELKPNHKDAYNNLGLVYKNIGKSKEAIAALKEAIAINPKFAAAYNNLGNVYYNIGKNNEAIAYYQKAIELRSDYAEAYNNSANAHYNLGNQKEAESLYKRAIALNPQYAEPYHNLAIVYFRQRQYKSAIKYYEQAEKLGFVDPALVEALRPYR